MKVKNLIPLFKALIEKHKDNPRAEREIGNMRQNLYALERASKEKLERELTPSRARDVKEYCRDLGIEVD